MAVIQIRLYVFLSFSHDPVCAGEEGGGDTIVCVMVRPSYLLIFFHRRMYVHSLLHTKTRTTPSLYRDYFSVDPVASYFSYDKICREKRRGLREIVALTRSIGCYF